MYFDSDGNTQIGSSQLAPIFTPATVLKKLCYQNIKSVPSQPITGILQQYLTSDLISLITWALDLNTLSCPYNVSASPVLGGSLSPNTSYFYRITGYNDTGETTGSIEVAVTTDTVNLSAALSWSELAQSEGYLIYRSTVSGSYSNARIMVIEDPTVTSWTDTGAPPDPLGPYSFPGINTDFDLPIANTTAGDAPSYGSPPEVMSAANLNIGIMQPGQMFFFWIQIVAGTNVLQVDSSGNQLNPRIVSMSFPGA
jgi:hypothetical protein